jgi:xylitol oxidase
MSERNWSGTYIYSARALHRPTSVHELRRIVAGAPRIRALGSRHSFSSIADSAELVSLERLPAEITIDRERSCVRVAGAMRYGDVARALDAHGLALAGFASLPHISVAGAIATATHGSGDARQNLAAAVRALELVTSSGDVLEVARGDADFGGMVVGLGATGVVTHVVLDVEPSYDVRQRVYERLEWAALLQHLDAVMGAGDSVSVFTDLGPVAKQVWVKTRVGDRARDDAAPDLFGATAATTALHPIAGMPADNATEQLGVPGPSFQRLPHFRMEFTPSRGDEIQSEYLVDRRHAVAALEAVHALAPVIAPRLQVCEIRTVARDALWMSPQYETDTLGIHFTWDPEPDAVREALARIEDALAPSGARPHWGKVFLMGHEEIAARYERLSDFRDLVARLDPRGAFANAWLERHVFG